MSDLPHEWRTNETRDLFEAILSLRTVDEAERFFRDLCTLAEIEAQRNSVPPKAPRPWWKKIFD